jgi:hypothetical protein
MSPEEFDGRVGDLAKAMAEAIDELKDKPELREVVAVQGPSGSFLAGQLKEALRPFAAEFMEGLVYELGLFDDDDETPTNPPGPEPEKGACP